jgi:hypothetical protein
VKGVVGHQHRPELQGVGGDHGIGNSDRLTAGSEIGGQLAVPVGGGPIERANGDGFEKGVETLVEATGAAAGGAEPQLGDGDGADGDLGGAVLAGGARRPGRARAG